MPPILSLASHFGHFRGNSDEEINVWNECARLVSNSIIYFNSWVLSELLDNFEKRGKTD
ncbi:MAG: Tn3 family transposase [Hahellaceae bacterium]|nr:Tn3 family transposase [Hahellaceae bacterium]